MLHFQNLSVGTFIVCRRKITTDRGMIPVGARGRIVRVRHELPLTFYLTQWMHPEPLDASSICTGAGGNLDGPVYIELSHLDEQIGLLMTS